MTGIFFLDKKRYSKVENWYNFYRNNKSLYDLLYDPSWTILFANLKKFPKFKKIDEKLRQLIKNNSKIKIYPFPSFVFKAFSVTTADQLKVVIVGQDPYFNCEYIHNDSEENNNTITYVPQAMGLSFSVPHGIKKPSSLINIHENLVKFGHIKKKPASGNLWYWAYQGVLLLNTALTVIDGQKKSHSSLWEWFTDYIIKYISDNMKGIIFVLWGGDAYSKISLINQDLHYTIISSHPSGLSVNKQFKNYPAFADEDHFGKINEILQNTNRTPILWE